MPQEQTDKPLYALMSAIRWEEDDLLSKLEQYVAGGLPTAPLPEDPRFGVDFSQFSKEAIARAVESERIYRATTIDEWLEIARDFYQDATGTSRRPPLFTEHTVKYWRDNWTPINRHFDPELMLNAVWLFGKDKTVDHATFQSMPYSDMDEKQPGLSWSRYERKADEKAYGVEFCVRVFPDEEIVIRKKQMPEACEPRHETVAHPNCKPRTHMRSSAFKVYDFAMGVSRAGKQEIYLGLGTVGEWTKMGDNKTIRKAVDWLVANGWLVEVKKPRKGIGGEGRYLVVTHDAWVAKHGSQGCIQQPANEGD